MSEIRYLEENKMTLTKAIKEAEDSLQKISETQARSGVSYCKYVARKALAAFGADDLGVGL